MQALTIHQSIVENHKSYLNSFTNISDPRIQKAVAGIQKLRDLHIEMDNAVLDAYGWSNIDLRHNFYEVDYLPENDRIRFTIHPEARREILKRLLELNHKIHAQEVADGLWNKKGKTETTEKNRDGQMGLDLL
jgi:hypothetical protein